MKPSSKWIMGGAFAVAVAAGGTGIAVAGGVGDNDTPLTGSTLDKARAAALEATGGGTVTETEIGDDGAAYGVEVRLADGRHVEVDLGRDFKVIGRQADDDGARDRSGTADD
jgi:hypothetical protein